MSGKYAAGTAVPPEKSQAEIQGLLRKYGADGFGFAWDGAHAAIAFRAHGRQVRFTLTLPVDAAAFAKTERGQRRTPAQQKTAMEQEVRRLWRALALAIKAKLEVVESGIATFEEEFLAHIVLPTGEMFSDRAVPAIAAAYECEPMPPLVLPGKGD